ncbi:MAG: hypothetical protein OXG72_11135 [Acidobacteria bacterium]|nr:hypothetical protein [Acidobacteriota bacterium]
MALADDLAAILQERFLDLLRNEELELTDGQSGMRVHVVEVSAAVAAVRLERVGHLPGLKERVPARRICDYALLAESDDTIHAVLVELKATYTQEEGPMEQLRRSLPVLECIRSACDVERGTGVSRAVSVGYVLVFEKEAARALDKRTLKPVRPAARSYKDITVNTFVGTAIPFPSLMATLPPRPPRDTRPQAPAPAPRPPTAPTAR